MLYLLNAKQQILLSSLFRMMVQWGVEMSRKWTQCHLCIGDIDVKLERMSREIQRDLPIDTACLDNKLSACKWYRWCKISAMNRADTFLYSRPIHWNGWSNWSDVTGLIFVLLSVNDWKGISLTQFGPQYAQHLFVKRNTLSEVAKHMAQVTKICQSFSNAILIV